MSTIPNTDFVCGPCIVERDGLFIYFEGGVECRFTRETADKRTSMVGTYGKVMTSESWTITGRPSGEHEDAAKYLPYNSASVGSKIFPDADVALVIHTADKKFTWTKSAMTKMPDLVFAVNESLWGDLEFTCLGKGNTENTAAASWFATASVAFADTNFDETLDKRHQYLWSYGAGFVSKQHEDGIRVSWTLGLRPFSPNNIGLNNMVVEDVTARATLRPFQLDEAGIESLALLQDTGALVVGEALDKNADDLVVAGGNVTFTLKSCGVPEGGFRYDFGSRAGPITFEAGKTWTLGAVDPFYSLVFA